MQRDMAGITAAFGPYLFIGTAVCRLMALRTAQLMKVIPVPAMLLLAGGLVFVTAFVKASQRFDVPLDDVMSGAPGALRAWIHFITSISKWSTALPVVLPPALVLIFRKRARQARA